MNEIRNGIRYLKANLLVARIAASYLRLYVLYRIFGEKRLRAHIDRTHEKNADRALSGILDLKAVYIKLGQVLSVMGGIFPPAFSERLADLQDAVPPHPYEHVERRFIEEFGKSPSEMGLEFDRTPLASASLGQVHRAIAPDGRELAIKVQYPDIERIVEMDLKVLSRAVWILDRVFPDLHYSRVRDQIREVVRRELDYRSEAKNLERMRANFDGDPDFVFPEIVPEFTTGRVLAMTYVEGIQIGRREELVAAGIDPAAVIDLLMRAFFQMFARDRFFHADPHPGNFLVQPGPKLVLLDFGAAEEVRDEFVEGMLRVFQGYLSKNDRLVIEGVEVMGFRGIGDDRAVFEHAIKHYFEKALRILPEDLAKFDPDTIRDLADVRQLDVGIRELTRAFQYPEGYFYVERSLFLLLGLCLNLDYTQHPLEVGSPYLFQFMFESQAIARAEAEAAEAETEGEPGGTGESPSASRH